MVAVCQPLLNYQYHLIWSDRMRSMCRVLFKKKRLQCATKAVNLHVRITQNCHGTSYMSLVQRQRRCDGRTCPVETLEQQVDGWRNEDVVQQLERPVYIAQTDNPVPGHARTCTPSTQACMWLDLPHRANVPPSEAGVSSRGRTSSCRSQVALQRSWPTCR